MILKYYKQMVIYFYWEVILMIKQYIFVLKIFFRKRNIKKKINKLDLNYYIFFLWLNDWPFSYNSLKAKYVIFSEENIN